jgi:hypothetical protein
MRNILLTIVIWSWTSHIIYSQNINLQWAQCHNCNTNPTFTLHNFNVGEITSDYGMRVVPLPGTIFHQGIDYVPAGTRYGDGAGVVSPEAGRIKLLNGGTGLKLMVVDGGANGHIFAYLHLFKHSVNYPYKNGAFVIDQIPNTNSFAIINLVSGIAYSDSTARGRQIRYQGVTYTTTDSVAANAVIAPIGKSSGSRDIDYHLHVSLLESGTANRSRTESIDPWNVIESDDNILATRIRTRKQTNGTTPATNFNGNICDHAVGTDAWNTINLDYNNNTRNVIEVEVSMPNATVVSAAENNKYRNAVMNEDLIQVLIKKASTPQAGYSRMLGSQNYGYIKIDPEGTQPIYPDSIYKNYGGLGIDQAGIIPFAYRTTGNNISAYTRSYAAPEDGNPYDYYFFPDFHHRIQKSHIPGNRLRLGDTPSGVFYNDDNYTMRSRVTNIHNDAPQQSEEATFTLDNFKPFITNIQVSYTLPNACLRTVGFLKREQNEGSAMENDGFISNKIHDQGGPAQAFWGMQVDVYTSEPMNTLTCQFLQHNSAFLGMTRSATNPLKWTLRYATAPARPNNQYNFSFRGNDLSGNRLVNVSDMTGGNNEYVRCPIYYRTGENSWSGNPIEGLDHFNIKIDPSCVKALREARAEGSLRSISCDPPVDTSEWVVTYQNCKARIKLIDNPYNSMPIIWEGRPSLSGYEIQVDSAGLYCYTITDTATCAKIKGCVYVDQLSLKGPAGADFVLSYESSSCSEYYDVEITAKVPHPFGIYKMTYGTNEMMNEVEIKDFLILKNLKVGETYKFKIWISEGCIIEKTLTLPVPVLDIEYFRDGISISVEHKCGRDKVDYTDDTEEIVKPAGKIVLKIAERFNFLAGINTKYFLYKGRQPILENLIEERTMTQNESFSRKIEFSNLDSGYYCVVVRFYSNCNILFNQISLNNPIKIENYDFDFSWEEDIINGCNGNHSIKLTPNDDTVKFRWGDGIESNYRQNLKAGTYKVVASK